MEALKLERAITFIPGIQKRFEFSYHAIDRITRRHGDFATFLAHLPSYVESAEVSVVLCSRLRNQLESTTYIRLVKQNLVLVVVHKHDCHIVITAYENRGKTDRLKAARWQSFRDFEWRFA